MKKRVMYTVVYLTVPQRYKGGYISIVVSEGFVEKTINAILATAATDKVGDGKIFILPVEEAYRIRTGESGNESLN